MIFTNFIGVIGYGRMGRRIVNTLSSSRSNVVICFLNPDSPKLSLNYKELNDRCDDNVIFTKTPAHVFNMVDELIVAVRPDQLETVAERYSTYLNHDNWLISVAAGVKRQKLIELFPKVPSSQIIRIMPNIYVNSGSYVPYLSQPDNVHVHRKIMDLFGDRGVPIASEDDFEKYTKINGCTPALVAWLYQQFLRQNPPCELKGMTSAMISHNFCLTLKDLLRRDPQEIIDEVASPGGVTRASIDKLTESGGI